MEGKVSVVMERFTIERIVGDIALEIVCICSYLSVCVVVCVSSYVCVCQRVR